MLKIINMFKMSKINLKLSLNDRWQTTTYTGILKTWGIISKTHLSFISTNVR